MSLFGGDSNATSPYTSEHSPQSSTRSSPSIEALDLTYAQSAQAHDLATTPDAGSDHLTDSESETDETDHEEASRLNRFQGRPITWQRYTSSDRRIASSLEQSRDSDLSAHLFNAHALKRRVRLPTEELVEIKPWQSRDDWQKQGSALQYTDISGETQTHLVPSKDWTAWPLHPDNLPQSPSTIAPGNDAGEEMREQMLATFLRLAKQHWSRRAPVDEAAQGRMRNSVTRSRSRSKSVRSARSHHSASGTDVDMKDDDNPTDGEQTHDGKEQISSRSTNARGRQVTEMPRPTFLVDDDKALRILQPTINSILARTDRLALAVRQTRLNHFGHGPDGGRSSQSEFTSGAESSGPASRPRSKLKARRSANRTPTARSRATSVSSGAKLEHNWAHSANSGRRHSGSSSSSDDVMGPSIAKINPRKRSRSASGPADDASQIGLDEVQRLGLIDWSEVLGLAAVIGWDQEAVSRTAQRCAALFGESMSLLPLFEGRTTQTASRPIEYIPSTLPPPSNLFKELPKRPFFLPGTLLCPHSDCPRHEQEYREPYRVIEHVMRAHKYDPRTNNSDNEERTVGAVHIDGFLQPVAVRNAGKGKINAVEGRKKQKSAGIE